MALFDRTFYKCNICCCYIPDPNTHKHKLISVNMMTLNSYRMIENCYPHEGSVSIIKNVTHSMFAIKIQRAWRNYRIRNVLNEYFPHDISHEIMRQTKLVRDERDHVWLHGYTMPPLFD
jgi:hypothetical protein